MLLVRNEICDFTESLFLLLLTATPFLTGRLSSLLYLYSCSVNVPIQNSFIMICSGIIIAFQVHSTEVNNSVRIYNIFKKLFVNNNSLY